MGQNSPPFASSNGQPVNPSGGASGAHDFVTDPKSHSPATGVRDFTKESRPQKMGACEPNPQEVPAGGRILKADPSGPAANPPSGGVMGVSQKPFRLHEASSATPSTVSEAGSTGDEGGGEDY